MWDIRIITLILKFCWLHFSFFFYLSSPLALLVDGIHLLQVSSMSTTVGYFNSCFTSSSSNGHITHECWTSNPFSILQFNFCSLHPLVYQNVELKLLIRVFNSLKNNLQTLCLCSRISIGHSSSFSFSFFSSCIGSR